MRAAAEKIARILRADRDTVRAVEIAMKKLIGHNQVLEKISEENSRIIEEKLKILGLKNRGAAEIYSGLIKKIKEDDRKIFEILGRPVCATTEGCRLLLDSAREVSRVGKGFFLKKEKAEEFLINVPPKNILKFFGYKDVY